MSLLGTSSADALQEHFSSGVGVELHTVPTHVAIIMDGNGRWAQKRGLPRLEGHRQGLEAIRRTIASAKKFGIRYLTLWAFSTENWNRSAEEVKGLISLLHYYLQRELEKLIENGVQLRVIGQRERFGAEIISLLQEAEERTRHNDAITLVIALSYGGRDDILTAARSLVERALQGELCPAEISEEIFSNALSTAGLPDPDLMIRPSGEKRISNFLLWQLSYAEFVFLDTLWPDFCEKDFQQALQEFQMRERRYGKA